MLPKLEFQKESKGLRIPSFTLGTSFMRHFFFFFLRKEFESTARNSNQPQVSNFFFFFFYAVINENKTWQKVVSRFLNKGWSMFSLKIIFHWGTLLNWSVSWSHHGQEWRIISMDSEDYSSSKCRLIERKKSAELNLVRLQWNSGTTVDRFLTISVVSSVNRSRIWEK